MKYRMMSKIDAMRSLALALVLSFASIVMWAQVPDAPNPPRLVNDFAGIFTPEQVQVMEDSLVAFSKKTSNQIAVVTMTDLGGMDKAQMAYEIGQKWGVGGKHKGEKLNNGVVILVKPKNDTNGEVFIATGYGVEGVLPDATASRIVSNEMIPHFRENDYYGGVDAALKVIKPLLAGEYSFEDYENEGELTGWELFWVIVIIVLFMMLLGYLLDDRGNNNGKGNSGTWGGSGPIIWGGGSSSSSSSSWGGGGGFGGFGGGSFGGGGAGGSW